MIRPHSRQQVDIEGMFSPAKDPRYRADGTNYNAIFADISRHLALVGDSVAADVAMHNSIDISVRMEAVRMVKDPVTLSCIAAFVSTGTSDMAQSAEELALRALTAVDMKMGLIADGTTGRDVQRMLEIVAIAGTDKTSVAAVRMITNVGFLSLRITEEERPAVREALMRRRRVLEFLCRRRD